MHKHVGEYLVEVKLFSPTEVHSEDIVQVDAIGLSSQDPSSQKAEKVDDDKVLCYGRCIVHFYFGFQ